jgi:hypothetical protein
MLQHPPYSPDLAQADFFLFPKVKEALAGQSLDRQSLKRKWEGVTRSIAAEDFATVFGQWYEQCEKCNRIEGDYIKKILEKLTLLVYLNSSVCYHKHLVQLET